MKNLNQYVSWMNLIQYQYIDKFLINKYCPEYYYIYYSLNTVIHYSHFLYNSNVVWCYISRRQDLTYNFIKDNLYRLDWKELSKNYKFTKKLLHEFVHHIYWSYYSEHNTLTKDIVDEFKDFIDLRYVKYNKDLNIVKYCYYKKKLIDINNLIYDDKL